MKKQDSKTCWTITDGHLGMMSQVTGLAEAIGLPTIHKTCIRRKPWKWLPIWLGWKSSLDLISKKSDLLNPPWPDLLITCGRQSIPFALAIKKLSQGKTLCVHIQNPHISFRNFDFVVAPLHDNIQGDNVIQTRGAVHKVTPQRLQEAAKEFEPLFNKLQKPYHSILIGGSTHRYKMTKEMMLDLIDQIKRIHATSSGSLLITPSFRTPYRDLINNELSKLERIHIVNPEEMNPYLGMLALSDDFFVTNDSVNMVCETCSTGKPVYILPLQGHKSSRPKRYIDNLIEEGIVRFFDGQLDTWPYTPFNDTEKAAQIIRQRLHIDSH